MASFESWMHPDKRRYRRILAGYQSMPQDSGNWSSGKVGSGVLIGTNRSISAPKLAEYLDRAITQADMLALTVQQAIEIYRQEYWNKIKGDLIQSQAIADLLADMKSSAGGNGVKQLQKAVVQLGTKIAVDGVVGTQTLQAVNSLIKRGKEAKLFNQFRTNMIAYYTSLNAPESYKKQWVSSLNEDYPPMKETNYFSTVVAIVVAIILTSTTYYYYRYQTANTWITKKSK